MRINPDRYAVIYNSKYDNNNGIVCDNSMGITAAAIASSAPTFASTKPHQNYYYNKYHEGLVELAKGFLNILLNQLVDKTMVAVVKEKLSHV